MKKRTSSRVIVSELLSKISIPDETLYELLDIDYSTLHRWRCEKSIPNTATLIVLKLLSMPNTRAVTMKIAEGLHGERARDAR